jgi:hypothetical protein
MGVTFNQQGIRDLYSAVVSDAMALNLFPVVIRHEPKAAPQSDPTLAVWFQSLAPARGASGLAATTGRVQFGARVYTSFLAKPEDGIDPQLLFLGAALLGAWSGGFTLGGDVMEIDLLGAYGTPLSMDAGYITHDDKPFRVAEIVLPVVVDSLWEQVPLWRNRADWAHASSSAATTCPATYRPWTAWAAARPSVTSPTLPSRRTRGSACCGTASCRSPATWTRRTPTRSCRRCRWRMS